MKRTITSLVFLLILLALTACGEKSQEDVTQSLDEKLNEMSSYKAEATMTIETGKQPQEYNIEIWYKKPSYYRVLLENEKKEQSQIILRNADGVFVLTPALNKSFRFQSDWPDNSSQPYLFESLARDILMDEQAAFTAAEKDYVFETKTNYQNNKALPRQEVSLAKNNLSPSKVKIMNPDGQALVKVNFSKFEWDAKFEDGDFDMDRNMTGAQLEIPTMAEADDQPLEVLYPLDMPEGVELIEQKEMKTENGQRVVMTFGGEKSFTLIEEKTQVSEATKPVSVEGEPVNLGFTVGAMSESSVSWTFNGVDYFLVSNDLTEEEMLDIAQSVQGQAAK